MKSIYRSDEGRRTMARWYSRFIERLGVPTESLEVETRHGRTHILVAGAPENPPLWCFHGANSSAASALAQVPSLLDAFRVYFPDTVGQPGRSADERLDWQGDAHGEWVLDVLDRLNIEQVHTLSMSLGGYIVLRTASLAPERIGRSVLWVPGGLVKPPVLPMLSLMGAAVIYGMSPTRERFARLMQRTVTDEDPMTVDFMSDAFRYVFADRRFPRPLADGALREWKAPVLVVTHERDIVFPPDRLRLRAEQMIPGLVRINHVPGWKHMPPFATDRLGPVLNDVIGFLRASG
ncbi:MAG: alpha/beta hydrolase [Myxococcota bacterium]